MFENLEQEPEPVSTRECQVCEGEHDDDIHSATVNVHAWFRAYVTRYFVEEEVQQQFVA